MFFKTSVNLFQKLFNNFSLNLIQRNKSHYNSHKLRQFLVQNKLKVSPILMKNYETIEQELSQLDSIQDKELLDLARDESKQLSEQLSQLADNIINDCLIDDCDITECCLDLNCGVGGQEAMLFTKELFDVYISLCHHQNWNYTLVANDCDTNFGGSRQSSVIISGNNCYQWLRHEAGVHRVQRFPKTDRHRVHTSTTTVAVIPVRHNIIDIKESDLSFTMKTSQGAGGQHVNKTLSCVRVTHIPTGIVTECQETRSQIQNKEIALTKLKAIISQMEYERRRKEEVSTKRAQVGIAARSDKIRTYNFPQNRITDHRLGENIYDIEVFMRGNSEKLVALILKLENQRKSQLLEKIRSELNQFFT